MRYPIAAPRRARTRSALTGLAALALLAGCGPALPGPGGAPEPAATCVAVPAEDRPAGASAAGPPLEVGVARPVDPARAPVPEHADEALVFRWLYEPLVRVDCRGRAYPALAGSWSSRDGGRRWSFELRDDARFADGTAVTARHVAASWSAAERRRGADPWAGEPPASVVVEDRHRISIRFRRPRPDAPHLFARPALAVVRPDSRGSGPATGTGPYRVEEVSPGAAAAAAGGAAARPVPAGGVLTLVPADPDGGTSGLPARVRIRVAPTGDLRDLLDAGVELVVTGDPGTLDYARLRPELVGRPLPWSRTYVLALSGDPAHPPAPPPAFLEALARDVVREEARPAVGLERSGSAGRCTSAPSSPAPAGRRDAGSSSPGVVAYPAGDRAARGIAERIVALASAPGEEAGRAVRSLGLTGSSPTPVAAALAPEELPAGLGGVPGAARAVDAEEGPRGGGSARDTAYVVGLPGAVEHACPLRVRGGFRVVPLVETRRRIVHRPLPADLFVDGDGIPFFRAPGGG